MTMTEERHTIYKEGGRIRAASLRALLDTIPDGAYTVTVKRASRKTVKQNNYLHVLFGIAADMMGREGFGDGSRWTKDKVKAYAKAQGLYPDHELTLPNGLPFLVPKDTRELDALETSATIERVIEHFWEEHRIALPAPNEQVELNITSDEAATH